MVTKPEGHFQDPQGHLRAMASYITEAWSQGGKSELRYSKVRPQADSFLKAAADNAARWRGDVSDIMPAPTWFSCCHWQQILDGGNAYRPKEGKWHPNRTQSILWRTLGCKVFLCWAWEDVLNVTLISTGWDNTSWSGRELSWGWAPYGSLGLCLLSGENTLSPGAKEETCSGGRAHPTEVEYTLQNHLALPLWPLGKGGLWGGSWNIVIVSSVEAHLKQFFIPI